MLRVKLFPTSGSPILPALAAVIILLALGAQLQTSEALHLKRATEPNTSPASELEKVEPAAPVACSCTAGKNRQQKEPERHPHDVYIESLFEQARVVPEEIARINKQFHDAWSRFREFFPKVTSEGEGEKVKDNQDSGEKKSQ